MTISGIQRACFRWRIGVVCNGVTVWSDYHCFAGCDTSYPGTLGLSTPEETGTAAATPAQVAVYPNPANEEINVILPEGVQAELVRLVDLQGKTAFEQRMPAQQLKINSSRFITGMYAVQVRYADGTQSVEYVVITR